MKPRQPDLTTKNEIANRNTLGPKLKDIHKSQPKNKKHPDQDLNCTNPKNKKTKTKPKSKEFEKNPNL